MTTVRKTFGIHTAVRKSKQYHSRKAKKTIILACLAATSCLLSFDGTSAQTPDDQLSIGQIQGREDVSPWSGNYVHFQGIVTGLQEDENERGARFYSVFVQDLPVYQDGDPKTSDGIAIFIGSERPAIAIGDILDVRGNVIEYYGLTEINSRDLSWQVLRRNQPIPQAVPLEPPADNQAAHDYFESLEGMLVSVPSGVVVGPTHAACGLAVVTSDAFSGRIIRHSADSSAGNVINVLHYTDVSCDDFPQVNYGDEILGISGPLTYHFEQFKVVNQAPSDLKPNPQSLARLSQAPALKEGQISVATFNLDDYFDTMIDAGITAEPVLDTETLNIKQDKLSAVISEVLNCPTVIGIQEVETRQLLEDLAGLLEQECNFRYEISHLPAPDSRGSDVALMSNQEQVTVTGIEQLQTCSKLNTGIVDSNFTCEATMQPLFSRPPLLVELEIGQVPLIVIVNHFKSKRGGEEATEPRRLAQADHLNSQLAVVEKRPGRASIIVVGDFNDYFHSPLMERLTWDGRLINVLDRLPVPDQYSYIFDGSSQLIDWILVSPDLEEKVVTIDILHVNADYQYGYSGQATGVTRLLRTSDHDIPIVILEIEASQRMENTPVQSPSPTVEVRATDEINPPKLSAPTAEASVTIMPVANPTEQLTSTEAPSNASSPQDSASSDSNRLGSLLLVILLGFAAGLAAIWIRRRR